MTAIRRTRLLILTDTAILGAGGSERFLRNLLASQPRDRYPVDVVQLAARPRQELRVARLDAVRLSYLPVEAIYAPAGIAAFLRVCGRVLRGRYDIVQSQHEKSDLICACLPKRRGLRRISNRRDMGFNKTRRLRAFFHYANARFDRIVAPSRAVAEALIADDHVPSARCVTIPNGVDTQRFRPVDAGARARLRAALGFVDNECLIGCVASFTPVKQHDILIEAFAQVHRGYPQVRLLLVGHGPLRRQLERQIDALGVETAVDLLGARSDVEQILPALDIFVLASRSEGMSNAILEAQACAIPVVATAVGGNAELVRSQAMGILVPAADPPALARALSELVAAPCRRVAMGIAAREQVLREHSIAAMAGAYERIYEELCNGD
jgi:glycosyltransferase involved in cell wall biosynthesis